MSNETKYVYASQVTLEASGASAATTVFVVANDTSLAVANHYDYPMADFVLTCSFGAAVAANKTINLYRQDMDIDGEADAPAPATTYPQVYVGSFALPSGQSASATYPLVNVPITKVCQFTIENATAQSLAVGWVLKATPKTYGPVA